MKNIFEFVRVYSDAETNGNNKPYNDIEFVVSKNFLKRVTTFISGVKKKEVYTKSRHQDGRLVFYPQNYEQFIRCLSQTKVDGEIGDIKVVYQERMPMYLQSWENNPVEIYYDSDQPENYLSLVDFAKELYCDERNRDSDAAKHKKTVFVDEANKVHEKLVADYSEKLEKI